MFFITLTVSTACILTLTGLYLNHIKSDVEKVKGLNDEV